MALLPLLCGECILDMQIAHIRKSSNGDFSKDWIMNLD